MCKTINHLLTLLTLADLLCGFHTLRKTILTTKYIYSPGMDLWHTYREDQWDWLFLKNPQNTASLAENVKLKILFERQMPKYTLPAYDSSNTKPREA